MKRAFFAIILAIAGFAIWIFPMGHSNDTCSLATLILFCTLVIINCLPEDNDER